MLIAKHISVHKYFVLLFCKNRTKRLENSEEESESEYVDDEVLEEVAVVVGAVGRVLVADAARLVDHEAHVQQSALTCNKTHFQQLRISKLHFVDKTTNHGRGGLIVTV